MSKQETLFNTETQYNVNSVQKCLQTKNMAIDK